MIPLNTEQRFGKKAFLLMLSKKMTAPLVFLLVTIIVVAVRDSIISRATVSSSLNYAILILIIITVALFLVGYLASRLQYRSHTFTLEEFDLKMKQGIMSQKEISVPYRQIQDVEIERSFRYRLFGLSKIIMKTAGHNESGEKEDTEIALDPIDKEVAEEIRNMLERQIGVQVVQGEREADRETEASDKSQYSI